MTVSRLPISATLIYLVRCRTTFAEKSAGPARSSLWGRAADGERFPHKWLSATLNSVCDHYFAGKRRYCRISGGDQRSVQQWRHSQVHESLGGWSRQIHGKQRNLHSDAGYCAQQRLAQNHRTGVHGNALQCFRDDKGALKKVCARVASLRAVAQGRLTEAQSKNKLFADSR